jgi:hypothetical protein
VSLSGRVAIQINQGKDGALKIPSIDFLASATSNPDAWGSAEGLKAPTGPDPDDFVIVNFAESNLLRVSGYVAVSVADFLHLSGQFSFSQSGTPQTVRVANGTATGGTVTKQMNVMTIGASHVNAFVGVGGPYFVDSDQDGDIDTNDTPQTDGAMGFVLRDLDFALALFKSPTARHRPQQLLRGERQRRCRDHRCRRHHDPRRTCWASRSTAARTTWASPSR